jgi:hypothetical protein
MLDVAAGRRRLPDRGRDRPCGRPPAQGEIDYAANTTGLYL